MTDTAIAPRLLTLSQAASYCGLSDAKFRGLYDGPVIDTAGPQGGARMRRFDRHDLDQWIERLKGYRPAAESGGDAAKWLDKAGFRKDERAA
jgi:predicted DNA-binding transcriptional regulator AlpA